MFISQIPLRNTIQDIVYVQILLRNFRIFHLTISYTFNAIKKR